MRTKDGAWHSSRRAASWGWVTIVAGTLRVPSAQSGKHREPCIVHCCPPTFGSSEIATVIVCHPISGPNGTVSIKAGGKRRDSATLVRQGSMPHGGKLSDSMGTGRPCQRFSQPCGSGQDMRHNRPGRGSATCCHDIMSETDHYVVDLRNSYKASAAVDGAPNFASSRMSNFPSCPRGICITVPGHGDLSIARRPVFSRFCARISS